MIIHFTLTARIIFEFMKEIETVNSPFVFKKQLKAGFDKTLRNTQAKSEKCFLYKKWAVTVFFLYEDTYNALCDIIKITFC